jgi:hypothetical protein
MKMEQGMHGGRVRQLRSLDQEIVRILKEWGEGHKAAIADRLIEEGFPFDPTARKSPAEQVYQVAYQEERSCRLYPRKLGKSRFQKPDQAILRLVAPQRATSAPAAETPTPSDPDLADLVDEAVRLSRRISSLSPSIRDQARNLCVAVLASESAGT